MRSYFVGCKRETHRSVQQGISLHNIFSVVYMVSMCITFQTVKERNVPLRNYNPFLFVLVLVASLFATM